MVQQHPVSHNPAGELCASRSRVRRAASSVDTARCNEPVTLITATRHSRPLRSRARAYNRTIESRHAAFFPSLSAPLASSPA